MLPTASGHATDGTEATLPTVSLPTVWSYAADGTGAMLPTIPEPCYRRYCAMLCTDSTDGSGGTFGPKGFVSLTGVLILKGCLV